MRPRALAPRGCQRRGPAVARPEVPTPVSPQRPLLIMAHDTSADKASSLAASCDALRTFVLDAVRNGLPFHDFELGLWQRVLHLGHTATKDFLHQQGTGDLGP